MGAQTTSLRSADITNFTVTGCRGTHTAGSWDGFIFVDSYLSTGWLTVNPFTILITNILGGTCRYDGILTGTPSGTDTFTASGPLSLTQTLSGICTSGTSASLTLTLPGAAII